MALGLVAAAVALGVVLQRITGVGFASVTAPALVLLWGPVLGVQTVNALAALCALILLIELRRHVDMRRTGTLIGFALATTPVGILLVLVLPTEVLQILLGAIMLTALFAVRAVARWRFIRGRLGAVTTGALAGIANATVGQAGPLMGAFALASRWELKSYVASMQLCWFIVNTAVVILKGAPQIAPSTAVVLCVAVAVGYLMSTHITRLMTRSTAEWCLFGVALAGSILILGRGILSITWR